MKKALIVLLALGSINVYGDNCERPRNTFDSLYCARKIFFELDDRLNREYKILRSHLGDKGKNSLRKSQIAWINERDAECTTGNAVIVSCAVRKTKERLQFLQERNYECNSVGCIVSKL